MKKYFFYFITNTISLALILIDKTLRSIKVNQFLPTLHDLIEKKQYYSIKILNKKIKFFCPSRRTLERVNSFFLKEPDTLNWINNFKKNKNKIIFWDIGANIGLYSIYAAIKFENIKVYSFEPSTSNTRTLSRNIFINSLYDKISILPIALSRKENDFSFFDESDFIEGGATHNFNTSFKTTKKKNCYNLLGNSIDNLSKFKIIDQPDYIKIDVDGIEDMILDGAKNFLFNNNNLKEISIEINDETEDECKTNFIYKLLRENNFEENTNYSDKIQGQKGRNKIFKNMKYYSNINK